jgi:hypothetical protein
MAIERRLWVIGVVLLAGVFYITGLDPISLLVLALVGHMAYRDVKARSVQAVEQPEYFAIGGARRAGITVAYAALIGFLLFALAVL